MAALTEQQLRELLEKCFERGVGTGRAISTLRHAGHVADGIYDKNLELCVQDLIAEAHVNTMYHGKRGDAAQEYIEQFFRGERDWAEFRWNEVWDRMNAVAPLDLRGEVPVVQATMAEPKANQYEMQCFGCLKRFYGPKHGARFCLACLVEEHR